MKRNTIFAAVAGVTMAVAPFTAYAAGAAARPAPPPRRLPDSKVLATIPCWEIKTHDGNGWVVPFPGPSGTYSPRGWTTCKVTIAYGVYNGLPAWKVTAPDHHWSYFTAQRTDPPGPPWH